MFLGQYEHTVDAKGRMTIPVRFRELLEEGAYITQGFDLNLVVLTVSAFERISEYVNQMSLTDPSARQLKRLIFAHADRVEVDRVGRILIPQFLRQATRIDGAAVVVGAGDYFEIWSPESWQQQSEALQDTDANTQRFAALNLPMR